MYTHINACNKIYKMFIHACIYKQRVSHRYLWGFLTPPVDGALFLAALVASCFLGALPPVDLRAVCLVRAMAL